MEDVSAPEKSGALPARSRELDSSDPQASHGCRVEGLLLRCVFGRTSVFAVVWRLFKREWERDKLKGNRRSPSLVERAEAFFFFLSSPSQKQPQATWNFSL